MSIHVAILKKPYISLILSGQKTVESRLTKTAVPPLNVIKPGERIFIKASGGPFMATAVAGLIEQYKDLKPSDIHRLSRQYKKAVCGSDEYAELKKHSRFAVYIHLDQVEPLEIGPVYTKSMRAWHVLDESLSPLMDFPVTAGAIRNRYVSLAGVSDNVRSRPVNLLLPDGQEVETAFSQGKPILKWRGWGAYYDKNSMHPGDIVRFVAAGPVRYRVSFRKQT